MFTGTVNIENTSLVACKINLFLTITRPSEISFAYVDNCHCQIEHGEHYSFDMPYLHLLSSVRARITIDDQGQVALNGTTLRSRYGDGGTYVVFQDVPLTLFKEKDNDFYGYFHIWNDYLSMYAITFYLTYK